MQSDVDTKAERMKAFPVSWVTTNKRLLLIGGCDGTLCRVAHAIRFDWSDIHVLLPEQVEPLCTTCLGDNRVRIEQRPVTENDVKKADLALLGVMDDALANQLAGWCRAHRVPLNAMDKIECCDLYYASLVFREPLVLSIGSGGGSPALSSVLRRWLEEHISPGWGHAAGLLAKLRERLPNVKGRCALLKELAQDPDMLRCIEADDVEGMRGKIDQAHDRFRTGIE
jgi:siroheme synthase-like protein